MIMHISVKRGLTYKTNNSVGQWTEKVGKKLQEMRKLNREMK